MLLLAGLISASCDNDGPAFSDASDAPLNTTPEEVIFSRPALPRVEWTERGTYPFDATGQTDIVRLDYPADLRYIALRAIPAGASKGVCYRLEPVQQLSTGQLWVAEPDAQEPTQVCTSCEQRVSSWPGAGIFVFPNGPEPLSGADTLELRVVARDCVLGTRADFSRFPQMATEVRLETAQEALPGPTRSATLGVRLAYAGDNHLYDPLEPSDLFSELWSTTASRFEAAGIALELEAVTRLAAHQGELLLGPDTVGSLDALHAEVLQRLSRGPDDVRFVPVLLVNCLRDDTGMFEIRGYTTHVPGALAQATSPSLVLLSMGCRDAPVTPGVRDAAMDGLELAHEIGHYLGIYHSDRPSGEHLQAGSDERLMHSELVRNNEQDRAWFSEEQSRVLLRHPDVFFE